VQREKELAAEQIKRTQGKLLGSYSNLQEKDPERWELILRQHELPTDVFSKEPVKKSEKALQPTGQKVKLKRKSTGTEKTVDRSLAEHYLAAHPEDFEVVE
jgi:hypothetical protein